MRASSTSISPARAPPGRDRRDHGAGHPRQERHRAIRSNEPVLAVDVVEYEGEPVARSRRRRSIRRAAAKLVAIDYEPLPAVLSVEEAMAREKPGGAAAGHGRGEVEPALASAPHRLSGELRCGARIISISKARSRSPLPATAATCTY
jgi:xanthine dehydrogenase large subunit